MYEVAARLDPDSYHRLARAVYAEMALAGITCVGEFHYLHHAPGGTRYQDPNAMGEALIAAAADAGIRITLLDTAYLSAGFGTPPNHHQLRFSDGTADPGVLGPRTTAVHATHLTPEDIGLLGGTRTGVCMCPTTERDLADGIGPAVQLQKAGSPLSLGSDSHAVIDLLEEARAMELDERLRTRTRGHWTAAALLRAATADGHA